MYLHELAGPMGDWVRCPFEDFVWREEETAQSGLAVAHGFSSKESVFMFVLPPKAHRPLAWQW